MNNCNFTGRLVKDPELKTKQDGGGKYIFFCLAVDAGKNKAGEKQTDWIDCVAYDKRAEVLATYCIKGSLIEVSGRLHTTLTDNGDGNKTKRCTVYADNIGILYSGKPKDQTAQAEPDTTQDPQPAPVVEDKAEQFETPRELPFEI